MPSLVTGIIGGIQGSSAAHDAANAQKTGYSQAASSVNNAVQNANPIISAAAGNAGTGVTTAAGTAGAGAVNAGGAAATGMNIAAGQANGNLDPYNATGQTATNSLNNLIAAGGFQFNPTMSTLENTPGYQFALQQGMKGVANSTAARGLGNSGAALKAAANYTTGLASNTYQQAFNNALSGYQANVNTLLPAASQGLNAANIQGSNLMGAAQYGGNANIGTSEYAGTAGMQGALEAGQFGMAGANQVAGNLINAGVYQGNTQIGTGNAIAQGDIGAANQWNSMLGSIGTAANGALAGGFGGGNGFSMGGALNGMAGFPSNLTSAANYNPAAGLWNNPGLYQPNTQAGMPTPPTGMVGAAPPNINPYAIPGMG